MKILLFCYLLTLIYSYIVVIHPMLVKTKKEIGLTWGRFIGCSVTWTVLCFVLMPFIAYKSLRDPRAVVDLLSTWEIENAGD